MSQTKLLNWFEIPTEDLDRASKFYSEVFDLELQPVDWPDMRMAFFPADQSITGGALVETEQHKPGGEGALVYFGANGKLDQTLEKIGKAGGQVILPRTSIGEHGFIAQFVDTEGNRVALHSPD